MGLIRPASLFLWGRLPTENIKYLALCWHKVTTQNSNLVWFLSSDRSPGWFIPNTCERRSHVMRQASILSWWRGNILHLCLEIRIMALGRSILHPSSASRENLGREFVQYLSRPVFKPSELKLYLYWWTSHISGGLLLCYDPWTSMTISGRLGHVA